MSAATATTARDATTRDATARDDAAARLAQRVERLRREHPDRAWRLLDQRFDAALRGTRPARRGELWRLRGHLLRALRRTAEAAGAYLKAESWYARAGEARERGRCAIGLLDSLMYLGRYDDARRVAARGRRLLAGVGDRVSLARLLNNEGNLLHRLDRPDRALPLYRRARAELLRTGDRAGAAFVDGNVANCLSLVGRPGEARTLYRRLSRSRRGQGFEVDALNADYNLAYLDFLEHRHERALGKLASVREQAQARGVPALAALAALDRSEILLRLNSHAEALAEAALAAAECATLKMGYERAKAETFAALAEHRLGRHQAARRRLERAVTVFQSEGNLVWRGECLVGLATVWWSEGAPGAARALLESAARLFARARDAEREACARTLTARVGLAVRRGSRERNAGRVRLALPRRASPRLRHLAWSVRAEEARLRGDLAAARRWLRRAALDAERLAARVLDEQWRASFWGEWGWPHVELARLELDQGRPEAALEALERGRGRALADPSRGRGAARTALPGPARTWAATRLARDRDRATRAQALPVHRIAPAVPPHLRRMLSAVAPQGPSAATLRRGLPPGALLLDFFLQGGAYHALIVTRDGVRPATDLASEQRVRRLCDGLLFTLRDSAFAGSDAAQADAAPEPALTELASLLLWPAIRAGFPEGPNPALAILPAGPLGRLPWPALPLPDGRRLCEVAQVTLVPGLRLGLRTAARPATGPPLIVGFDGGGLDNVGAESRAVLEAFPGARLLEGKQATAEVFFDLAPRASWIHFAGHGAYDAQAPERSGLRLADRWITAEELGAARLGARWVSLSACQTARSLVQPGEEWFGMPRALLLAGAGAVMAAQWDVLDRAAADLMTGVYRELATGVAPAAALARAQAARLGAGAPTLDWAGFVTLGGPATDTFPAPLSTRERL